MVLRRLECSRRRNLCVIPPVIMSQVGLESHTTKNYSPNMSPRKGAKTLSFYNQCLCALRLSVGQYDTATPRRGPTMRKPLRKPLRLSVGLGITVIC